MKVQLHHVPLSGPRRRAATALDGGFTLAELLTAITVFMFVVSGILFANLYGLKMFRITETTLNATDDARKAMGKMTDEVRKLQGHLDR